MEGDGIVRWGRDFRTRQLPRFASSQPRRLQRNFPKSTERTSEYNYTFLQFQDQDSSCPCLLRTQVQSHFFLSFQPTSTFHLRASSSNMQPDSLLDLQDWVQDKVGLLTITAPDTSLIDLSFKELKTGQCIQLNESTLATMQLLEGTMLLPINVEPDETATPTPPKYLPSATMSTSTLDDLSQLDMYQPIDRRFPPTVKAGNCQTPGTYRLFLSTNARNFLFIKLSTVCCHIFTAI